jgi:hypothetical protein
MIFGWLIFLGGHLPRVVVWRQSYSVDRLAQIVLGQIIFG